MIIFASTNDSVQFHENVLNTFLNRKFNMYLDDDMENENYDDFDSDTEAMLKSKKSANKLDKKSNICQTFALFGNMDQHKRAEILSQFCKTASGVLICTVQ